MCNWRKVQVKAIWQMQSMTGSVFYPLWATMTVEQSLERWRNQYPKVYPIPSWMHPMWIYILLCWLFSIMTLNMHLCTQSMRDFVYVTLVFDDGKWVEAHKMILAASSCLCLAKTSIRVHPLIFMRGIQSNILEAFDLRGLCLMLGICALLFARPGSNGKKIHSRFLSFNTKLSVEPDCLIFMTLPFVFFRLCHN